MDDVNSKMLISTTSSWPKSKPNLKMPVCIQPSSLEMNPPWRPVCRKSAAFEPSFRLLSKEENAVPKTMRTCKHELFLEKLMGRSSSSNSKEPLHCDCLAHWDRPASAGAARPTSRSRPIKRPAWRPGSAKSSAFDPNPGLLCDPGPVRPQSSHHRERHTCKSCGLRAKPSPVLRTLVMKIENLMSESPFGWCVSNP